MKVLLATDCSAQANAAAKFLNDLNFEEPIDLVIVTALGDPYSATPDSTQDWFPELLLQEKSRAERNQEELASLMKARVGEIEKVCRPGHPVKILLEEAETHAADLIVMGAQGHSFLGRLLIGSVSDSVATHAKCSVLVVRPAAGGQQPDASADNRLVIGYDSSKASREAVEEILALGWKGGTHIQLLSVAPIYDYLLGNGLSPAAIVNEEEIFNEMKQGGESMKQHVDKTLPGTESVVVHDQRVGDAIAEQASKVGADLVVVGDAGHSLLDDFLLGSTTKYVLRHAKCSVWISRRHRATDASAS